MYSEAFSKRYLETLKAARFLDNKYRFKTFLHGSRNIEMPFLNYGRKLERPLSFDHFTISKYLVETNYKSEDATTYDFIIDIDPFGRSYVQFYSMLTPNTRNCLRKFDNRGGSVNFEDYRKLDMFYDMYLAEMHRLGGVIYPKRLFDALLKAGLAQLFSVSYEGRYSAFAVVLLDQHLYGINWAVQDEVGRQNNAYYGLFNSIIIEAFRNNIKYIDLGTSRLKSPQAHFKKRFLPVIYSVQIYQGQALIKRPGTNDFIVRVYHSLPVRIKMLCSYLLIHWRGLLI